MIENLCKSVEVCWSQSEKISVKPGPASHMGHIWCLLERSTWTCLSVFCARPRPLMFGIFVLQYLVFVCVIYLYSCISGFASPPFCKTTPCVLVTWFESNKTQSPCWSLKPGQNLCLCFFKSRVLSRRLVRTEVHAVSRCRAAMCLSPQGNFNVSLASRETNPLGGKFCLETNMPWGQISMCFLPAARSCLWLLAEAIFEVRDTELVKYLHSVLSSHDVLTMSPWVQSFTRTYLGSRQTSS